MLGWLPMLLQGLALNAQHERALLLDFSVYAFVLPLLAFSPVLVALKKQGLSRCGALVSQQHLAFEARWLGGGAGTQGADALGSQDMCSLAGVALTRLPVKAILDSVKGLLLGWACRQQGAAGPSLDG
jgi:hypothetical protein